MTHLLDVSIAKGIIVRYRLVPDLPAVEGDATQIRQVIMNLVTNASEAIGTRSGTIGVTTGVMHADPDYFRRCSVDEHDREGDCVFLEIADDGCGMTADVRGAMFDPFFTTKRTGRGLGMAAVLGIVRGHRGAIRVDSEPGRGTTIRVLFPASDLPVEALAASPEDASDEAWRGAGLVLLADDEDAVRVLAERMLQVLGFEVLAARDGREAVAIFTEHRARIVCVLLDLTMPHMDGEEAFRAIRKLRPDVPIVLSSGYNEQEIAGRFEGTDLAGFVAKPYRLRDLRAQLRKVLAQPPQDAPKR